MKRALLSALVALAVLATACKGESPRPAPAPRTSTTASPRPVRVGVWSPPDPAANTYGGATVRTLIHPQLFRPTPDGKWQASLAQPGTDKTGTGSTTASFRLRRGARWSDGTPITAADLRRTLNPRFVTAVDEPTATGTIVVHFNQPLPGWRRLWSGIETIAPPGENVYGGPYKLEKVTAGLETVLVANEEYFGGAPRIREVRLVLVPDSETQARLMEQGDLDVIAPLAFTDRRARLGRIDDAAVHTTARGGWTASLIANPTRLTGPQRQTLFALADGPRFTDVLLHGEAVSTAARTPAPSSAAALSPRPAIVVPRESSVAQLLVRGMQRVGYKAERGFDVRAAEFDQVLGTYAAGDFDALLHLEPGAVTRCWSCSFASVDAALARDADAGQKSAAATLERRLVDDFRIVPLWRERPVAAVRDGLRGVSVNGFHVAGPAWNVEKWRWES